MGAQAPLRLVVAAICCVAPIVVQRWFWGSEVALSWSVPWIVAFVVAHHVVFLVGATSLMVTLDVARPLHVLIIALVGVAALLVVIGLVLLSQESEDLGYLGGLLFVLAHAVLVVNALILAATALSLWLRERRGVHHA